MIIIKLYLIIIKLYIMNNEYINLDSIITNHHMIPKKSLSKIMSPKFAVFSYGSNSIKQLQGRLNNLLLKSYYAYTLNYKRIFCGYSENWKGGVASLFPCNNKKTEGIVVFLNKEEIEKLDKYEKNYNKQKIICNILYTSLNKAYFIEEECIVYIANNNDFIKLPSIQYLVAINLMLNEHNKRDSINISGLINNNLVNIKKWIFPKNIESLNLYSFFIIINSYKKKPWKVPKDLNKIVEKLNSININNIKDLNIYIKNDNGYNILNNKLISNLNNKISLNTYNIIKKYLL